jgi:CheY-like chemotaxis protein
MPQGSGRLLAEQLKTQRSETRGLIMTGYADDAALRHGVSQAEVALIEKPFSPRELARKVGQVLDSPEVP